MELQQLAYFIAVADEGSFTRGAQREHVVQSTMSAAVGRLEHEFGQSLFRRIGHRIELTTAGGILLDRARAIVGAAQDVRRELDSLDGGLHGTVTLGTALSTGTFPLAEVLGAIRREHPGIMLRVQFSPLKLDRHLDRIVDGTFDLALIPEPDTAVASIGLRPVGTLDLVLAAAPGTPLPDGPLRCADLAGFPFIDFPAGWANRTRTDQLFEEAGVERDVAIEVADTAMALDLVRDGLGIAFLPRRLTEGRQDLRTVTLDTPTLSRVLVLARLDRKQSPAVETVHQALLERAAEVG
ncbi:LysR family transcriptional regulator [Amycolatopsis sp. NBC_00345]|uniref:LysR family transcriptional regulator n=1 Tax=Amycolatopsis sp. NBC_00345 TaxID=2975955 RepID=UPI002E25DBDA